MMVALEGSGWDFWAGEREIVGFKRERGCGVVGGWEGG